jgi:hypothetical protein
LGYCQVSLRDKDEILGVLACGFSGVSPLESPHVWATLTNHDTVIFQDPDFEVFIDPDGDTHNYYEFEINPLQHQLGFAPREPVHYNLARKRTRRWQSSANVKSSTKRSPQTRHFPSIGRDDATGLPPFTCMGFFCFSYGNHLRPYRFWKQSSPLLKSATRAKSVLKL